MIPVLNATSEKEDNYNKLHLKTRNIVERLQNVDLGRLSLSYLLRHVY